MLSAKKKRKKKRRLEEHEKTEERGTVAGEKNGFHRKKGGQDITKDSRKKREGEISSKKTNPSGERARRRGNMDEKIHNLGGEGGREKSGGLILNLSLKRWPLRSDQNRGSS